MALLKIQVTLLERLVLVEQRLPLHRVLTVTRLGTGELILDATEVHLGPVVGLLQTRLALLERFVLLEQGLPVHGPLQLGVLQLVELLLFGLELLLDQRQFPAGLGKLRAHVVLQRLEVRDEFLVLLQDVGERLRLGGLGHQAALRPCCM